MNSDTDRSNNIQIPFSPGAYDALRRLAAQQGRSIAAVLQEAIALEQYAQETRAKGGRVLAERDGKISEILGA